ncbi:nucleoporin Nup160 [Acrasis kona]|uniref:Nucleoporin Nup160 n=1 Tax=Acrasis kona TaxID=1008807 RepID=A0AAW2YQZ7_9EUKA
MYREVSYRYNEEQQERRNVIINDLDVNQVTDNYYTKINDHTGHVDNVFWKLTFKLPSTIIPTVSCHKHYGEYYFWIATSLNTLTRVRFSDVKSYRKEWHLRNSSTLLKTAMRNNDNITCVTAINHGQCAVGTKSGQIVIVKVLDDAQQMLCEEVNLISSWSGWLSSILSKKQQKAKIVSLIHHSNNIFALSKDAYLRVYSATSGELHCELDLSDVNPDSQTLKHIKYPQRPMRFAQQQSNTFLVVSLIDARRKISQFKSLMLESSSFDNKISLTYDVRSKIAPEPEVSDYMIHQGNLYTLSRIHDGSYSYHVGPFLSDAVKPPGLLHSLQPSWTKVHTHHDDLMRQYANVIEQDVADKLPQHLKCYLNTQLGLEQDETLSSQDHIAEWRIQNYPLGFALVDDLVCALRVNSIDTIRYGDVIECCYLPNQINQKWGTFMYFMGKEEKKDAIADMLHLTTTIRELKESIPATQYLEFMSSIPLAQPQRILNNAKKMIQGIKFSTQQQQLDPRAHVRGYGLLIELLERADHDVGDSQITFESGMDAITKVPSQYATNICLQFISTRFECAMDLLFYCIQINNMKWCDKMINIVQMLGLMNWLQSQSVMQQLIRHYQSNHLYGESFMELFNKRPESIHLSDPHHVALFMCIKTISYIWSVMDDDKINAIEFANLLLEWQQFETLQYYCTVLSGQIPHLNYFIAMCHLHSTHNIRKARDYFVNCGLAIAHVDGLFHSLVASRRILSLVCPQSNATVIESMLKEPLFHYYNNLRLLVAKHPDLVIDLVNLALGEELIDSNLQDELDALQSVLFNLSLTLQRYDDAYVALVSNENQEKRMSDLRRFIMHVCDKKSVHYLVDLPFLNMQEQVCDILNELARCTDAQHHATRYFDALIGWYGARSDHANAAKSAWECAHRLKRSEASMQNQQDYIKSAQSRIKYYLIAIHCLCQQYQDGSSSSSTTTSPPSIMCHVETRKRNRQHLDSNASSNDRIISLNQIQGEYLCAVASLELCEKSKKMFDSNPSDLVVLLSEHLLLQSAFDIAVHYSLDMNVIFLSITNQCIIAHSDHDDPYDLIRDEFLNHDDDDDDDSVDSQHDASQLWWNVLKKYLNRYDQNATCASLCIGVVLDKSDQKVPQWLVDFCLQRNVDALIRVYIKYGLFAECVDVWIGLNRVGVSSTLIDYLYAMLVAESKSDNHGIKKRAVDYCRMLKQ